MWFLWYKITTKEAKGKIMWYNFKIGNVV